jgi:hypothetical protein
MDDEMMNEGLEPADAEEDELGGGEAAEKTGDEEEEGEGKDSDEEET